MSGIENRQGLEFQDLVLAERMLDWLIEDRRAEIRGTSRPPEPTFGAETSVGPDDQLQWDNLTIETSAKDSRVILEEVKSGMVRKEERIVLWKRLRQTYTSQREVIPRLTVNKGKLPSQSSYFEALSKEAEKAPCEKPERDVKSAEKMAQEALYYLTSGEAHKSAPLSVKIARELLGRFEYQAIAGGEELEKWIEER